MRTHTLALVAVAVAVAALALGCAARASSPPLSAQQRVAHKRAVAAALDDWHDAAARADEERYFAHFLPHGVFLGTDATERWDARAFRAYAHPHFARGRAWSFRASRRVVTLTPDATIAWFDEDLETARLGPARGSGVLVRSPDGVWRIAQYNLALTIPNERFDAVRAALTAPDPVDAGVPDAR